MNFQSITYKVILFFIAFAVLPLIIVGILNTELMKQEWYEDTLENLWLIAELHEGTVYAFLDSIEIRTSDFSSDGLIQRTTARLANQSNENDLQMLNKHLASKKELDPSIKKLFVMDAKGTIIASTDLSEIGKDESADSYFQSGRKQFSLIEHTGEKHGLNESSIVGSAPIINNGELAGVLAAYYDTAKLKAMLSGEFQLGKGALTGYLGREDSQFTVYLVNENKEMFIHPTHATSLHKKVEHNDGMPTNLLPVNLCIEKGDEFLGEYISFDTHQVIGVSMCNPERKWTLITEMHQENVFEVLNNAKKRAAIVTIVFALLVILIGLRFSRNLTRPLIRLNNTAQAVGKGNFNARADESRKDEIGELAKALNSMTKNLKAAQEKLLRSEKQKSKYLEKEVAKKTKELRKKISELEKWNKLTSGRELKMIELKKELARLKKRKK